MKNRTEITTPPVAGDREEPKCRTMTTLSLAGAPFMIQRDWYQRYWLDEGPGCVQAPPLRARIGMAAKRILRRFRSMRNGGSASVDAAVPSSRGDIAG